MRWSSHSDSCCHTGPGSCASMAASASRVTTRARSRRSKSMSATRSATPSPSSCCQREERRRSSSTAVRASSSSRTSASRLPGSSSTASSLRSASSRCSVTLVRSCTRERWARAPARWTTSSVRWATRARRPDSSWSSRSPRWTARAPSVEETGKTGASSPCLPRWAASRSTTVRQCADVSVLVTTHVTLGHSAAACRSRAISGAVNSWEASVTRSTASAVGSRSSVLSERAAPTPPRPGVSTSCSPPVSSRRGSSTSACTSWLPAAGAGGAASRAAREPMSTGTRWVAASGPVATEAPSAGGGASTRTAGDGPPRTTTGTRVATSSETGQTGAPTRALTRELLPCFGSPTTRTRTAGSATRLRTCVSRRCRSGRSHAAASAIARSTNSLGAATVTSSGRLCLPPVDRPGRPTARPRRTPPCPPRPGWSGWSSAGVGQLRGEVVLREVVGEVVLGLVDVVAGELVVVERVLDREVVADHRTVRVVDHVDVVDVHLDVGVGVVEAVRRVEAVVDRGPAVVGVLPAVVGRLATVVGDLPAVDRDVVVLDLDVADRGLGTGVDVAAGGVDVPAEGVVVAAGVAAVGSRRGGGHRGGRRGGAVVHLVVRADRVAVAVDVVERAVERVVDADVHVGGAVVHRDVTGKAALAQGHGTVGRQHVVVTEEHVDVAAHPHAVRGVDLGDRVGVLDVLQVLDHRVLVTVLLVTVLLVAAAVTGVRRLVPVVPVVGRGRRLVGRLVVAVVHRPRVVRRLLVRGLVRRRPGLVPATAAAARPVPDGGAVGQHRHHGVDVRGADVAQTRRGQRSVRVGVEVLRGRGVAQQVEDEVQQRRHDVRRHERHSRV